MLVIDTDLATLLAAAATSRGGSQAPSTKLRLDVLAAALRELAEWLAEQSRTLANESTSATCCMLTGAPVQRPRIGLLPQPERAPLPPMSGHSLSVLTRREREVAAQIARGLRNSEIADELVIATSTTERHVANILIKLGMRSRAEVAVWAAETGLTGRAQVDLGAQWPSTPTPLLGRVEHRSRGAGTARCAHRMATAGSGYSEMCNNDAG
jgi:DNA-binding NarL/FixJ family response regulator